MVQTCYICKWRADKEPRRSFHKFPFNEDDKRKWLDIIGKSNVSLGKRTSICSIHFEKACFRYGLVNGRELLRTGSVPTLQLTKPPEVDVLTRYNYNPNGLQVKIEIEQDNCNDWELPVEPMAVGNGSVTDVKINMVVMDSVEDQDQKLVQPILMPQALRNNKRKPTQQQTAGKKNKMDAVRVLRIQDNCKRKDLKQSSVRKLVERLRRDHIKLKNYIQTLEERQKTVGVRQKTAPSKKKSSN